MKTLLFKLQHLKINNKTALRRIVSFLLCICISATMLCNFSGMFSPVIAATATDYVQNRVADPSTMDDYMQQLLSMENGSRYAGRIWTDKSVFAYKAGGTNKIGLDMEHDGYKGEVGFNADFAHVFSALASSQVVNEYPPSPIDMVLVLDISSSMSDEVTPADSSVYAELKQKLIEYFQTDDAAQYLNNVRNHQYYTKEHSIRYDLQKYNESHVAKDYLKVFFYDEDLEKRFLAKEAINVQENVRSGKLKVETDSSSATIPEVIQIIDDQYYAKLRDEYTGKFWGKPIAEVAADCAFEYTRLLNLIVSADRLIDALMQQNPENRVSVVVYDRRAEVSMPLAHYTPNTLTVGQLSKGHYDDNYLDSDGDSTEPYIQLFADTLKNQTFKYICPYFDGHGSGNNHPLKYVDATGFSVVAEPVESGVTVKGVAGENVGQERIERISGTDTNAGITAGLEQLANEKVTTFSAELSTGKISTVPRIPAAIVMTDGGSNTIANGQWYDPDYDLPVQRSNHKNSWSSVVVTQSLLNAAYLKSAVEKNYVEYMALNGGAQDLPVYTVGVDLRDDSDDWVPARLYPMMDPAKYFLPTDQVPTEVPNPSVTEGSLTLDEKDRQLIGDAYQDWQNWLGLTDASQKITRDFPLTRWSNGTKGAFMQDEDSSSNKYVIPFQPEDAAGAAEWHGTMDWKNGTQGNFSGKHPTSSSDTEYLAGTATYESFASLQAKSTAEAEGGTKYASDRSVSYTDNATDETKVRSVYAVTQQDMVNNINYVTEFYNVTSGQVESIFENILTEIEGQVFVPISGDNDAGVGDSITYQDPLGDYMEIKNQAIDANTHLGEGTYDMSLLLFGKMHGLVRAGVYDWKWNDDYMTAHPEAGDKGETAFPMGWYRGNPENPETPTELCGNESGTYPKGYDSAEQAWADGWVYRFNFSTLLQFVPITGVSSSDVHPSNLPDQVKNTVYTCYRFAGSKEDRNALHRNPIFGDVPEDLKKTWEAHGSNYPVGNEDYADVPGVYRLSDIRVWVEELGDYTDSTGVIVPNTGYDRSLYMNIPTAAVPTQLATITLGKDGVMSYETNLGSDHPSGGTMNGKSITQDDYYAQSTPLRLFYSVGLEEDLILRDKDGNQTGVNFSKISPEYISAHTVEGQDYVWFISNYYSNTSYTEYVTDTATSRTRGDPTVSFSPSIENRYYVFQKPLPLYAHAYRNTDEGLKAVDRNDDQSWSKEDNQKGGNGSKKWESVDGVQQQPGSWVGGEYMGTYTSAETFKEAKNSLKDDKYIKDDKGVMYLYQDDGIVFLEQDLMDHVTSEADGSGYAEGSVSFNSSDYFFLLVEYYLPNENTVGVDDKDEKIPGSFGGRMVQRAVARRGSEFGSGFASDDINNGDMLCWTDMNGKITLELDYLSKSDTGDLTRGEPTFQKLTYNEPELRTYLRDTCKISESIMVPDPDDPEKQISVLDQQVKYWKAVRANEKVQAALEKAENGDGKLTQDEFNKYFTFAVSARPGGIRSGDMSNNRHAKEENVTNTAQNYYVPTVSDNSATDNGVILNTYLGNNGYLEIANQMLHVTKMIETPEDLTLTEGQMNEEFNYQIYVQGVTGTHSAIRTQYNKYAKAWERELAYIDVLTDNSNLIVDNNSRRAVFIYEAQEGSSMVAKQVIANGEENGNPIYYYASEDGTLTIKRDGSVDETINAKVSSDADLYYLYLPSNGTGTDAQHTRRLYQNKEYEGTVDGYVGTYDENETEYNNMFKGNGTTTFVNPGDHEITGKDPGAESRDSYRDATQFDNRPAGTKTYWAQDAELIPVTEVQAVENASDEALPGGPSTFALESVSSGMWTHGESCAEGHKKLQYYTFVIRKPNNETSETAFESPFMTRSQYMTVELEFGKNANNDGGSNGSGSNLTADDLYDNIVPSADRPDLFNNANKNLENEEIAKNTAEFTLKHGEGLLLTGLDNRIAYRFTEKLTNAQLKSGYKIKEISHIQQRGSESIYRPGVQQIPIYSSDGATYSNVYPAGIQGKETENGLTWAIDKNGKENSTVKPKLEPFAHTNATMWMYYATMDVNSSGNHHQKSGESSKEVEKNPQVWNGGVNSYTELKDNPYTVADNPSCEKCDEPIYEGDTLTGYLHYMYKNGVLVDPHYEGEASTYLRNMARYGVSPTVRFGVNGEKQEDTAKLATLPENDYYDYSGVYSVYGNTGWFEEQANYTNTVEPDVLVITKNMVDMSGKEVAVPPDKEFTFTLKLTSPENGKITASDTLHYWKGNISDLSKAPDRNSYDEINALPDTLQLNKADGEEAYTATIKLKAKEAVVLYGLIADTEYTVTETKDDKYPVVDPKDPTQTGDYYTQTGTIEQNSEVVAPADSQNRAGFINQLPSGILTVEKEIRNNDPDTKKEFGFTVTLTAKEGESLDKSELTMTKVTKAADETVTQESIADPGWKETKTDDRVTKLEVEFKLKHGEKVVINGIPLDTTYTVDETNRNGYTLKDIETSGNVSVHGKIASGKIEKAEAAMTFVNVPAVFLPEAGGMGILIFCIIGTLLIACATAYIVLNRKKLFNKYRR